MGLATIGSHSQREHTEIHKTPKFGVNQASFDRDTAIEKQINGEMYGIRTLCRTASGWPYISLSVNFDIFKWLYLVYFCVYLHQTWGFCKAWSAQFDFIHGLKTGNIRDPTSI